MSGCAPIVGAWILGVAQNVSGGLPLITVDQYIGLFALNILATAGCVFLFRRLRSDCPNSPPA